MVLKVELPPDLERRLVQAAANEGIPIEDYVVRLLTQHLPTLYLPMDERRKALLHLLDGWINEMKGHELAPDDDEFLLALDAERLSDRKLYPPELKGVTW